MMNYLEYTIEFRVITGMKSCSIHDDASSDTSLMLVDIIFGYLLDQLEIYLPLTYITIISRSGNWLTGE